MKKIYLHPLALRIWHWVNALMIIILTITGIQIRIPGVASLRPQDPALLIHRYAGWAMVASWVFWLVYSLATDNLSRQYVIRRRDFSGIFRQAKYYLISIFRGEENPFRPTPDEKFNPLQKLAYGSIMGIFAPVLVVTGILFSDILFFRKYMLLWNIVGVVNALHVIGAYVFVLYLVVHLYMATLGTTAFSHIKAMIVGYEEEPDSPEEHVVPAQENVTCQEFQKE
jgi:thiosulfate reductase cytochrome b subunit